MKKLDIIRNEIKIILPSRNARFLKRGIFLITLSFSMKRKMLRDENYVRYVFNL